MAVLRLCTFDRLEVIVIISSTSALGRSVGFYFRECAVEEEEEEEEEVEMF